MGWWRLPKRERRILTTMLSGNGAMDWDGKSGWENAECGTFEALRKTQGLDAGVDRQDLDLWRGALSR